MDRWLDELGATEPEETAEAAGAAGWLLIRGGEKRPPFHSAAHRLLDWLERQQSPENGLWYFDRRASRSAALAAAAPFVALFAALERRPPYGERLAGTLLEMQQNSGLFGRATPAADLAAVALLVILARHAIRADQSRRALVYAYAALQRRLQSPPTLLQARALAWSRLGVGRPAGGPSLFDEAGRPLLYL
jgi:hypothetical protein